MFTKFVDTNLSQKSNIDTFYTTMKGGNVSTAQTVLNEANLGSHALQAQYVNPVIEAVYNEDYYNTTSSTTDLQTSLYTNILRYIGVVPKAYSSTQAYAIGDLVTFEDNYYICIQNSNGEQSPLNTDYWTQVPKYVTDDSYINIYQQWIDRLQTTTYPVWDETKTYYKNDLVSCGESTEHEGSVIALCITKEESGISGLTHAPTPDNTTDWVQFMLRGNLGFPSLGVLLKGAWESGVSYNAKDMVVYNTDDYLRLYVAINANADTETPDKSSNWFCAWETAKLRIPILTSGTGEFIYIIQSSNTWTFYINQNSTPEVMYLQTLDSQVNLSSSTSANAALALERYYQIWQGEE